MKRKARAAVDFFEFRGGWEAANATEGVYCAGEEPRVGGGRDERVGSFPWSNATYRASTNAFSISLPQRSEQTISFSRVLRKCLAGLLVDLAMDRDFVIFALL